MGGGGGGQGVDFLKFTKKWGSKFFHKMGGIDKIGGCLKKGGYHLFS